MTATGAIAGYFVAILMSVAAEADERDATEGRKRTIRSDIELPERERV
jgi:hypothetical protein